MPVVETTAVRSPEPRTVRAPRRLTVWRLRWSGRMYSTDDLVVDRAVPIFDVATGVKTLNDVGTWRLRFPVESAADVPWMGDFYLFTTGNETLESGPMTSFQVEHAPSGALVCTVQGISEEYVLRDRVIYPDPQRRAELQTTASHDARSGVASSVMIGYVAASTTFEDVPNYPYGRDYGGLTVAPDPMLGPSISMRERWSGLLDVLQRAAYKAKLGFRVHRAPGERPEFQVFAPRDRSHVAVFDSRRGNVANMSWTRTAPTVSRVIAGGQGELTARMIAQDDNYTSTTNWRRLIERFRDQRSEDDEAQLRSDNQAALVEGAEGESLSVTPTDSPLAQFGEIWRLGDYVRARMIAPSGEVVREVVESVQQIEWVATPSGVAIKPVIGTDGTADLTGSAAKRLAARMNQIEGAQ